MYQFVISSEGYPIIGFVQYGLKDFGHESGVSHRDKISLYVLVPDWVGLVSLMFPKKSIYHRTFISICGCDIFYGIKLINEISGVHRDSYQSVNQAIVCG